MRYLALDLGDRRIGVALSDATGMIARPLEVFRHRSRDQDFAHIRDLIEQHDVEALVVGFPLNMNGTEGPQASWVRDYVAALSKALPVPILLWDERLSTEEAHAIIRQSGRPKPEHVDAIAAAVILQGYLDSHRGHNTQAFPPGSSEDVHPWTGHENHS